MQFIVVVICNARSILATRLTIVEENSLDAPEIDRKMIVDILSGLMMKMMNYKI
ncbi:hypothetical protein MA16_Dca028773 [Dendrobium catenatum]|uniref:Uncharacterized protein n=1 Tax=Dendrobium catenatum TaxID=906689 RepID=A0A2I0VGD7_9ASPA|nr:hypothetical protein MA16_Dca028773 [Dendrobium catenatum]